MFLVIGWNRVLTGWTCGDAMVLNGFGYSGEKYLKHPLLDNRIRRS
jgi:hypothetical protein